MPQPNIFNISQTIKKLWSAQEFGLNIISGEIRKSREQELSLHATLNLTWAQLFKANDVVS